MSPSGPSTASTRSGKPREGWDVWSEERAARVRGWRLIVGVDEVGRGPLAGPVVAATVALPFELAPGPIRDSKALSARGRATALEYIREHALAVGVAEAGSEEVDRLNILRATHEAMRRAVANAAAPIDGALIDGLPVPYFPVPFRAIVKGDARSVSIAAASIVAKEARDATMRAADLLYPGYGFAQHMGYPTPTHLAALDRMGPCPIHRRSFGPVAACGAQLTLDLDDAIKARGWAGEDAAATLLEARGHTLVCRRYSCPRGEIDLVTRDGDCLVFTEVKATDRPTADLLERISVAKRRRIIMAAEDYLARVGPVASCRFDVVLVDLCGAGGQPTLTHHRDAFRPDEAS
ncbi:MAG: ribonuclease HII [Armatimonadetes bacterium]|nr:ribonuclease HII [Armatimonadota bacterium]